MRALLRWTLILAIIAGLGAGGYAGVQRFWKNHSAPVYRTAEVSRGEIASVINATGTVTPVLSIRVGTFASGPVKELNVDFNSEVKEKDILARIDPAIYGAMLARDEASLDIAKADAVRVEELLKQAVKEEQRDKRLGKGAISESDLDKALFARTTLDAQLLVARATIKQAEANLKNSRANLDYCEIRSPVDGVVIDRKIDKGQTLAAQFQTPDLFVVAKDLRKEIHIYASVDEADIGLIRKAKDENQPVRFTVDAWPDELFEGHIPKNNGVRMNSTVKENVVTYQVVVSTTNPDLHLMPGMTAKLSFQIDRRPNCLRIPNNAIRFFPKKSEHVRPEDRKLLEGSELEEALKEPGQVTIDKRSAEARAKSRREANRHHVWVNDGEFLRAVEVVVGINDYQYSELIKGDLKQGDVLVTGTK
jgi:HlyD family secretion protein